MGELIPAFISVSFSTCSIEMHQRVAMKYTDNGTYSGSIYSIILDRKLVFDRINNLGVENRKGVDSNLLPIMVSGIFDRFSDLSNKN